MALRSITASHSSFACPSRSRARAARCCSSGAASMPHLLRSAVSPPSTESTRTGSAMRAVPRPSSSPGESGDTVSGREERTRMPVSRTHARCRRVVGRRVSRAIMRVMYMIIISTSERARPLLTPSHLLWRLWLRSFATAQGMASSPPPPLDEHRASRQYPSPRTGPATQPGAGVQGYLVIETWSIETWSIWTRSIGT